MKKIKWIILRNGGNGMTLYVILLCSVLMAVILYLLIISPGKPANHLDVGGNELTGSISEKIWVKIGGVKQGMFISGKNINNPILLYVHGGPCFPNYFLIEKYKPGLEELFTVCYWEQRGGGLSYSSTLDLEKMTLDQFSEDAIDVANYLRNRFGKDKVYILAHSGGSAIALPAVSKAPELFHAYIAMAQITRQYVSEKMAYDFMLDNFTTNNNQNGVRDFKQYNDLTSKSDIQTFFTSVNRDKYMHKLGIGTMRNMRSVFCDVFIPVWTCRAYTLREKINIWKSKLLVLPKTKLLEEVLWTDFMGKYPTLDVPVYFISGKYDLTVNTDLSKNYFNQLKSPHKGFYTFKNSAHSPLFEEPNLFLTIMKEDVLKEQFSMAD